MKQSEMQQENLALIEEAIQKTFGCVTWEPVALLGGGLSPALIYRVSIASNEYAVRLDDPLNARNNLARQYHAMNLASEHGIGPKVFYFDSEKGIAIMQFINQKLTGISDLANPEHVSQLAQLLKILHSCELFRADRSIFERVDAVHKMMTDYLQNASLVLKSLEMNNKLEKLLSDPADLRSSHCDINPANIFFDGQNLLLIDWNAASPQSFYFDLACSERFFYFYNQTLADGFLKQYFGRELTNTEKNKFRLMSIFVSIYFGFMFIYLSGSNKFPLMGNEEINALPSYQEFMGLLGQGKEKIDDPHSQQKFGFVFLKTAMAEAEKEGGLFK